MSIFSDLKPFAKNDRNIFDKSHSSTFSTKVGMCVPVFVEHTVPDTKLKIDLGAICRTVPMQKANFTSISTDVDFFFVPYRQLWSSFPAFYYGRNDKQQNYNNTARSINPVPTGVPTFSMTEVAYVLVEKAVAQWLVLKLRDIYDALEAAHEGFNQGSLVMKYKEYGSSGSEVSTSVLSSRWLFEQNIDYLIEHYFGHRFGTADCVNGPCYRDIHGRLCVYDQIRNFDMLGYGNLLPLVKAYTTSIELLIDKKYMPALLQGSLDVGQLSTDRQVSLIQVLQSAFGTTIFVNPETFVTTFDDFIVKLCTAVPTAEDVQDLQFPLNNVPSQFVPRQSCNAFSIMAAFKVWCDFYRSSQYDDIDYSFFYNLDYLTTGRNSMEIRYWKIINMLVPQYHLYNRDIFTGGYPNAQFGDVAVAGLSPEYSEFVVKSANGDLSSVFADDSYEVGPAVGGAFLAGADLLKDGSELFVKNSAAVSALAVRQALAIQKWKETILRAGNRERDLLESMFGVHSKYINDKYVDYVASFNGQINVNPVAATTENENASIGELGAYAVGTIQGKEFDFATNEFGVLVGIMYVRPEVKYDAFGFNPMNTKSEQNDYYNPKFQNLGLAPVFSNTYNAMKKSDQEEVVLSYLSRYWEYKTAISHAHGEFYNSSPLQVDDRWLYGSSRFVDAGLVASTRGAKSSMVSVRDVHSFDTAVLQSLYIAPDALDTLFYADEDGLLTSDQFDVEMSFRVKAILPMSVEGLPNY